MPKSRRGLPKHCRSVHGCHFPQRASEAAKGPETRSERRLQALYLQMSGSPLPCLPAIFAGLSGLQSVSSGQGSPEKRHPDLSEPRNLASRPRHGCETEQAGTAPTRSKPLMHVPARLIRSAGNRFCIAGTKLAGCSPFWYEREHCMQPAPERDAQWHSRAVGRMWQMVVMCPARRASRAGSLVLLRRAG